MGRAWGAYQNLLTQARLPAAHPALGPSHDGPPSPSLGFSVVAPAPRWADGERGRCLCIGQSCWECDGSEVTDAD